MKEAATETLKIVITDEFDGFVKSFKEETVFGTIEAYRAWCEDNSEDELDLIYPNYYLVSNGASRKLSDDEVFDIYAEG